MTDFSKTVMYKIVCNDLNVKECYVGHTINMVKRKCVHKSACNNEKINHTISKYTKSFGKMAAGTTGLWFW